MPLHTRVLAREPVRPPSSDSAPGQICCRVQEPIASHGVSFASNGRVAARSTPGGFASLGTSGKELERI